MNGTRTLGWILWMVPIVSMIAFFIGCPPETCKPVIFWWIIGVMSMICGLFLIYIGNKDEKNEKK